MLPSRSWTCGGSRSLPLTGASRSPDLDERLGLGEWLEVSSRALRIFSQQTETIRMNRYGLLAMEFWTRQAPHLVAGLGSEEQVQEFFTDLGLQAQSQIDEVAEALQAQVPGNLPYLERVGRLRMAQLQAEEAVLHDLVYDPVGAALAEAATQDLDQLLGLLPTSESLQEAIDQIVERAEWTAISGDSPEPVFGWGDRDRIAFLEAGRQLLLRAEAGETSPELLTALRRLHSDLEEMRI